jgi:diacylglycerol kinase
MGRNGQGDAKSARRSSEVIVNGGKNGRVGRAQKSPIIGIYTYGRYMPDESPFIERSWGDKFRDAFRGLKAGVRGQISFYAHIVIAATVVAAGAALGVGLFEWCLLVLCITSVLVAEFFNSSLESMAKAITGEPHPHIGNSLDIGSAAVLTASIGAAVVGAIIFGHRLGVLFGWWHPWWKCLGSA